MTRPPPSSETAARAQGACTREAGGRNCGGRNLRKTDGADMKRTRQQWLAVAVLMATSSVAAQVVRLQTGQALDANYRAGSGGYNPMSQSGGFRSQLYVTGQVTGLGAFRGRTGYRSADQLGMNLPSGRFDTFRGQSVGLAQALGGGAHQPGAYYGRTATAFGAGAILAGRTIGGTGIPLPAGSTSQAARKLYVDATKNYSGLMALRPYALRVADAQRQPAPGLRMPSGETVAGAPGLPPGLIRQGPPAIGLLRGSDRLALANELYKLARVDALRDHAVKAEVDASVGKSADEKSMEADKPPLPPLPQRAREAGQGPEPAAGEESIERDFQPPSVLGLPAPNHDVFLDLLRRLRDDSQESRRPVRNGKGGRVGQRALGNKRLVEATGPNRIVVHGLAGYGKDQFNVYMGRARDLMRDGKYYAAAHQYGYAAILNPGNPLAQIGQCLAHFGAGEALTAAFHLRQGFQLFPPIMKTEVAVPGIIGTAVFERRLKVFTRHLGEEQGPIRKELLLLAAFLHHAADHKAEAQKAARKLKEAAGDDKLLVAYADYVCTGKLPSRKTAKPRSGK